MRSRELFANFVGLGDVGHGGHPPGLLTHRINQGRDIQPGIKNTAIFSPNSNLKTTQGGATVELIAELAAEHLAVFVRPIWKWRARADQLSFAPACHLTKSRVHISDTTIHVHGSHTGEHRVFHGAAKIGFGDQGLLRLQASAGVSPRAN